MLGVAEIIIAKHRNGATGDVHLSFRKELAKFADMETNLSESYQLVEQTFSSKMNADYESLDAGIRGNESFNNLSGDNRVPF